MEVARLRLASIVDSALVMWPALLKDDANPVIVGDLS